MPPSGAPFNTALLDRRSPNGVFSAKIHWGEYAAYLDNPEGIMPPCDLLFSKVWVYDYGVLDELAVNAYWLGQQPAAARAL